MPTNKNTKKKQKMLPAANFSWETSSKRFVFFVFFGSLARVTATWLMRLDPNVVELTSLLFLATPGGTMSGANNTRK